MERHRNGGFALRAYSRHPDAGQRSAIIYSLVVSCQRHGKDPLAYLKDVLARLPMMTNRDDLGPLTPALWQPA
jgi:transposase